MVSMPLWGSLQPQASWSAVLSSPRGRHHLSSHQDWLPQDLGHSLAPLLASRAPRSSQNLESPFPSSQGIGPFIHVEPRADDFSPLRVCG